MYENACRIKHTIKSVNKNVHINNINTNNILSLFYIRRLRYATFMLTSSTPVILCFVICGIICFVLYFLNYRRNRVYIQDG